MRSHWPMWKLHTVFFAVGLVAVLFMGIPYLILGQDAIVSYHDQLDGEVIAYLLQARHLFQGSTLPEFLGGVSKTALVPPAPAAVLLFLPGNAFVALALLQVLGSLCGYLGMFLLSRSVTGRAFIPVVVGVLYAYLPFLPVYGLAQYGLPLLLYLLLEARGGRHRKLCLLYSALYALTSSLVLVGFGVLGVLLVWVFWEFWRARKKEGVPGASRCLLQNLLVMLIIYLLENVRLLVQTFGSKTAGGVTSHKAEYVLFPEEFLSGFLRGLLQGGQHSGDFHAVFLAVSVVVTLVCGGVFLVCRSREIEGEQLASMGGILKIIVIAFGWNLFFSAVAALWNSLTGIRLREQLQAVGAFQADRLLWLASCLWYLILACVLALVAELWQQRGNFRFLSPVLCAVMAVTLCCAAFTVLRESNLKFNVQKLRNPEYRAISFNDYYAVGVYSQVEEFLREQTGEEKENYLVVSLGIDPAAALYHGFYCLDGYSNNYPLEYKHAFRRIIAPELDRNGYLAESFDNWGNRVYLFSSECPGYYTIEKGGFVFLDYRLDVGALREMGGSYLFSAAYILNASEQGLTLLREEPFSTEDSYYQIYVYGIAP